MASIIPGFEYDVFISYRHNDNRSGWVTEFVRALHEELASTIKDPVSIYFDTNPHDGLLETHNVDKSLEGKLKCLIFIPIISQTYSDPKSFAWQYEYCVFNRLAREDMFGRDIKLGNGNVASRILPVKIHELDAEDKVTIEKETGGVLRAIEFIYKESGVNRPLRSSEENASRNQHQTTYRNQINKGANAIKELIHAMNSPSKKEGISSRPPEVPKSLQKRLMIVAATVLLLGLISFGLYYFTEYKRSFQAPDKSIAVLPFENMNKDPEQDYFSNGIAEDILNHLSKISDLKVKSRTSTLQYKSTQKSITEIGQELNVGNVVEGSVRKVGDKVRVVVQLIDAKTDLHLWSETYDRDFKDVLALQSEIAIEIANTLEARLSATEREKITTRASQDITAYDYFLKAREVTNRYGWGTGGNTSELNDALSLIDQAIGLDKNFGRAIALKGMIWYLKRNSGVNEKIWTDSALYYSSKAVAMDPSNPEGYLVRAGVLSIVGKREETELAWRKAYEIAPNDPGAQSSYGRLLIGSDRNEKGADLILKSLENQYQVQDPRYYLALGQYFWTMGHLKDAERLFLKAKNLDPGSGDIIYALYSLYEVTKEYGKALEVLKDSNQESVLTIDAIAETYTLKRDYISAIKYYEKYRQIEKRFEDTTQIVPLRHRLAFAYAQTGRKKEADQLMVEHLQILDNIIAGKRGMGVWYTLGAVYFDRALCLAYFGKKQEAVASLNESFEMGWRNDFYYHNDPLLANIRDYDPFKTFLKKADDFRDFERAAFTNAFNRAVANRELKGVINK